MADKIEIQPKNFLHRNDAKRFVPRNVERSTRIVPTGTAIEVGQELRNMIRVVDADIIGATNNWDPSLKRSLVEARIAIGRSPREEAESLSVLIAAVGLHIVSPERWEFRAFSRKLIPVVQSAREILGIGRDDRFEDVEGRM